MNPDFRKSCQEHLDRYFAAHPNAELQKQSLKALRLLAASEDRFDGKPEGWAAGIVYAVANRDRRPVGVPGLLNSEFEQFFSVSMGTARRRAAKVSEELSL